MDKKTVPERALTFDEFEWAVFDFVSQRRFLVFIIFPLIFSLCCLLIASYIEGGFPRDAEVYASGFALPFAFSIGAYVTLFCGDINHSAKGNELTFGCFLTIIFVPLLIAAYGFYLLVRMIRVRIATVQQNVRAEEGRCVPFEDQVKRLNELLNSGMISKADYDDQLARLIKR